MGRTPTVRIYKAIEEIYINPVKTRKRLSKKAASFTNFKNYFSINFSSFLFLLFWFWLHHHLNFTCFG